MSVISRILRKFDRRSADGPFGPTPAPTATPEEDPAVAVDRLLDRAPAGASIHQVFGAAPDPLWLWANTEGVRRSERLRALLPGAPDETMQRNWTGAAGDTTFREAYEAYRLFKEAAERGAGRPLSEFEGVLDFGSGWGRIIRFFLKDLEGDRVWGHDCYPEAVEVSRRTVPQCRFALGDPMPPAREFADESFDLIYSFSVFSHLSEEAANRWVGEFRRLLRPGGIMIATTRAREFIGFCDELREQKKTDTHVLGPLEAFLDSGKAYADYDAGRYVYSGVGGGGVLDGSFYGETCIPEGYVRDRWVGPEAGYEFVDYIVDRSRCVQNVIVLRRS